MAADTYTVQRSTTIQASPQRIYELIVDFRQWTRWSPWEDLDPQLERRYSGADSGVGATYAWSGNRKAGEGRMEIVDATAPTSVRIALAFQRPFKSRSTTDFLIQPEGDGSLVTWSMTGPKTWLMKLMGIFTSMDKMVGPDFEKGLARLKAVLTSTPDAPSA